MPSMNNFLTPDSLNLFARLLLTLETGSLISKIERQNFKNPPPSIAIFIKTDFFLTRSQSCKIWSINPGRSLQTIDTCSKFSSFFVVGSSLL